MAAFSGFWWSHIEKSRLPQFLETFHSKLEPGALVVFTDNCYVAGSSTPLFRTDEEGNTYQLRKLENGEEHQILKNFPDALELDHVLGPYTADLTIQFLQYFWCASYRI